MVLNLTEWLVNGWKKWTVFIFLETFLPGLVISGNSLKAR